MITPRAQLLEELRTMVLPWYGVSLREVMFHLRFAHIVKARDACVWYIHFKYKIPLTRIARLLDKDHTTIFRSIGRHEMRCGLKTTQAASYMRRLETANYWNQRIREERSLQRAHDREISEHLCNGPTGRTCTQSPTV